MLRWAAARISRRRRRSQRRHRERWRAWISRAPRTRWRSSRSRSSRRSSSRRIRRWTLRRRWLRTTASLRSRLGPERSRSCLWRAAPLPIPLLWRHRTRRWISTSRQRTERRRKRLMSLRRLLQSQLPRPLAMGRRLQPRRCLTTSSLVRHKRRGTTRRSPRRGQQRRSSNRSRAERRMGSGARNSPRRQTIRLTTVPLTRRGRRRKCRTGFLCLRWFESRPN